MHDSKTILIMGIICAALVLSPCVVRAGDARLPATGSSNPAPPVEDHTRQPPSSASPDQVSPAPKGEESNNLKETGTLKPFVPTERIAADQAVDFPYDI